MLEAAQQMTGRKHCSDLQPPGGQCSLRGKTRSKQLRAGPGALVSVPDMPLGSGGAPAGCRSLTLLVLAGVYLVLQSASFFAGSSEGSIAQNYEQRRK